MNTISPSPSWNRLSTCSILLLIVYTVIIGLYTSFLTLCGEDWVHFSDFTLEEAWDMCLSSYTQTNARIGETGAYFIGSRALEIFHFVHPIFVLLAVISSLKLCTGQWTANSRASLIIMGILMLGIPTLHAWIWWFIGNLNWFYPITLSLLFFALYENMFYGNFQLHWAKVLLMIPLAFIMGMSNENTAATAIACYLSVGGYWVAKAKSRLSWQYIVLGSMMLIAAYLFYTAPGPGNRAVYMDWELNLDTLLYKSLLNAGNWLYFFICYWRLLIPLGLLLLLARKLKFMSERSWILLGCACFSQAILIAAPNWGAPRSYTLPQLLLLLVISGILYQAILRGMTKRAVVIFCTILAGCCGTWMTSNLLEACAQYRIQEQIGNLAKQAKAQGKTELTIYSSQLDMSPICPQIPGIPRCIIKTDIRPQLPLLDVTIEDFQRSDTSVQGDFPYQFNDSYINLGKRLLNIPMAKRYGLRSLVLIMDSGTDEATGRQQGT